MQMQELLPLNSYHNHPVGKHSLGPAAPQINALINWQIE